MYKYRVEDYWGLSNKMYTVLAGVSKRLDDEVEKWAKQIRRDRWLEKERERLKEEREAYLSRLEDEKIEKEYQAALKRALS